MAQVEKWKQFWSGKRVLITGHTGFVGSWLALCLIQLDARVVGYSIGVPTEPSLFEACELRSQLESITADVRNAEKLSEAVHFHEPQFIFHLAAQPLVTKSYVDPLETYGTNIIGTVNLFEAVRTLDRETIVVNMTSDKCYENNSKADGYTEDDQLGGKDPYSSSKACSELITRAYRESFFNSNSVDQSKISLSSIRAGNIIGGGDWAMNRLIPDSIRAFETGNKLGIRYPNAVRPWQHVLDVVYALLHLAKKIVGDRSLDNQAWNVGPNQETMWSVEDVVRFLSKHWDGSAIWKIDRGEHFMEEVLLTLDNSKARQQLGWRPVWNTETALIETLKWYQDYKKDREKILKITIEQLERYITLI